MQLYDKERLFKVSAMGWTLLLGSAYVSASRLSVPGHQFIDLVCLRLSGDDALKNILEVGERLDMIEVAGLGDRKG